MALMFSFPVVNLQNCSRDTIHEASVESSLGCTVTLHTSNAQDTLQMCCNSIALHVCIRPPLHIASLPDHFPDFPHVLSVPLTDSESIFCVMFESIKFMIFAAIILHVLHRCETSLCIVRDECGMCLVTVFEKMKIRCVAL